MLNTIIDRLKEIPDCVLLSSMEDYTKECEGIIMDLMKVLPAIIMSYSIPEMSDMSDDATYWPKQVQKMCDAVERFDRFAIYDSFYNEMYMNICEYRKIIINKGISVDGIL